MDGQRYYITAISLHGTENAFLLREQADLIYRPNSPFKRFLPLFCPLACSCSEQEGEDYTLEVTQCLTNKQLWEDRATDAAENKRLQGSFTITQPHVSQTIQTVADSGSWLMRPLLWPAAAEFFRPQDFADWAVPIGEPGFLLGYSGAESSVPGEWDAASNNSCEKHIRVCILSLWTLRTEENTLPFFIDRKSTTAHTSAQASLEWETGKEHWIKL